MDQDMKSNNLDVHLGHIDIMSGPRSWQSAFRKTTTQHPIAISNGVCICSNDFNVCVKAIFVRGPSTHQAVTMAQFTSEGTNQCLREVNLVINGCFLHMKSN